AAAASHYYLLIDGLNGGSTDAAHQGWFEIDYFSFDVSYAPGAVGGGGTGKASFSPLQVALSFDPAAAGALADIAQGKQLKAVKLEGVNSAGQAVYDLTLADVSVSEFDQFDRGFGSFDSLIFEVYERLGLIPQAQKRAGPLVLPDSFGFDLVPNTAIAAPSLPSPSVGTGTPAAAASHYYLLIDGLNG